MSNSNTPAKRPRKSASSTSSTESPQHKRQVSLNYRPAENMNNNTDEKLAKVKFDSKAPNWAKQMFEILCSMNSTLNNVSAFQKSIEGKVDRALASANKAEQEMAALSDELDVVKRENCILKQKLVENENYSKKYNLKVFNVPEDRDEGPGMLINKLAHLFDPLGINLRIMLVDNVHRLPSSSRGPRPIIIKFASVLDRNAIWNKRDKLNPLGGDRKVYLGEHFAKETENNRRTLLPFRRSAIEKGMSAKIVQQDKLLVDDTLYTVDTLDQLPDSIKPEKVSVRELQNHIFFFSKLAGFSNWHPSDFEVDDQTYINNEQFIMEKKALTFGDEDTARKIMMSKDPGEMKWLGSKVKNFSEQVWKEKAPEIALAGVTAKFSQNDKLKTLLLNTGKKALVEAAPRDKMWGIGRHMYDKNIMSNRSDWGENLLGNTLMKVRTILRNTPAKD